MIYKLPENKDLLFPDPLQCESKDILAVGGDLSVERVAFAYENGIFPWYNDDEPYCWWSPDPRAVLYLDEFHISKSLTKEVRKNKFTIKFDSNFEEVLKKCATTKRKGQNGTWITSEMHKTYLQLHNYNIAHSVEAYLGDELVGGLYGVATGIIFSGESMFATESNSSKICLVYLYHILKRLNFLMIDCQQYTNHLASFGAREISREKFITTLKKGLKNSNLKVLGEEFSKLNNSILS